MSYKIETLISEEELKKGILRVADEINRDYKGRSVHLICIIKGGVFFMTELSKHLNMDVTMAAIIPFGRNIFIYPFTIK